MATINILQNESKIWAKADLLRGWGIKESEWPFYLMPFFALRIIVIWLFAEVSGLAVKSVVDLLDSFAGRSGAAFGGDEGEGDVWV